jgi:hypothetical protein
MSRPIVDPGFPVIYRGKALFLCRRRSNNGILGSRYVRLVEALRTEDGELYAVWIWDLDGPAANEWGSRVWLHRGEDFWCQVIVCGETVWDTRDEVIRKRTY